MPDRICTRDSPFRSHHFPGEQELLLNERTRLSAPRRRMRHHTMVTHYLTADEVRPLCALVILAGGKSSRMGRPKPLHAVYRADNAPILRRLLAAGRRRPVDLFAEVPTLELPEAEIRVLDPAGLTFMNTNTPEEWERALALAAPREGFSELTR